MFKWDKETESFIFKRADLREVYEPIVTQFGFEYEKCLDTDGFGLVWTKEYKTDRSDFIGITMIIREANWDFCPSPEEATFFSTSIWLEEYGSKLGCILFSNPKEWQDWEEEDDIDLMLRALPEARAEVNNILEQCRVALSKKLLEIQEELKKGKTWEQIKKTLTYDRLVPEELHYPKLSKTYKF